MSAAADTEAAPGLACDGRPASLGATVTPRRVRTGGHDRSSGGDARVGRSQARVNRGANLLIVNGLGRTDCTTAGDEEIPDCPNGVGNLIVGYNEMRGGGAK